MLKNVLWRKHASLLWPNFCMLLATGVICFLVCFATENGAFENYEQSKVLVFSYVMSVLWSGLFNALLLYSNQKSFVEADFDNKYYSPLQYLIAVIIIETVLCMIQTVMSCYIFTRFFDGKYNANGLVTGSFTIDFMITTFLIMFSAMTLGMFIGILVNLKVITVTIPFILIIQMLFSNCIFELSGDLLNRISDFVIAKYGASSIGALLDLNSYPLKLNLDSTVQIPQPYFDIYRTSGDYVLKNWSKMVILGIVPFVLSLVVLQIKAKKVRR